jgi:hypothetical protein
VVSRKKKLMSDTAAEVSVLTASGWKATPSAYSSLRVLRFHEDGSGTLTYGYGQTIYAIIKCRWAVARPGILHLSYSESPPYQRFQGFLPDDNNREKELDFTLTEGDVEGIESVIARPFKYRWTLELSASPYPEGLRFPYSIPRVFYGHYRGPQEPTA